MANVRIDSGAVCAQDRFKDIPKERWRQLVSEKRNFLSTRLAYDCRCLVEFCEEAELVWEELGFESAADMIRNGYELDPVEIDLAVAWLKHNEPQAEIGLDAIKQKVQEARDKKEPGKRGPKPKDVINGDSIKYEQGTTNANILRRLARDNPELLDEIESGELSINAAAIKAGIRKKPSNAEICVKAFRKAENRLEALKLITGELEPYEKAILKEWIDG
jgi:hypothetical protein